MRETLDAIDRMELAGQLSLPERADVAYRIWSGSDLSVSALSSSVEVYNDEGILISRFALNFPGSELDWREPSEPSTEEWAMEEETYPGEPDRPRVLHARRAVEGADGDHWDFQVRLVADWSNLPFISTPNPYMDRKISPSGWTIV